jgi:hypothetical protein
MKLTSCGGNGWRTLQLISVLDRRTERGETMGRACLGLLAALFSTALTLAVPARASACSCVAVAGKRALPSAAAMFTGKAIKVEFLEPDTGKNEPAIVVTFEVAEVWKGPSQETLKLRTTYNRWTCSGYYFKEGMMYFVTAHQVKPLAEGSGIELAGVNPCGGTRELDGAVDLVRDLGPGEKPDERSRAKRTP